MQYNLSTQDKAANTRVRSIQEKSVPKFLRKVFHILEENKHNEYVSWSHDGEAIVIKKPIEFAEKVLPCFFKHNNLASFVRQLNMYNFKKKKNYHYDHAYGHESFQKGRIELLRNIQRKTGENNQISLPKLETPVVKKEDVEVDVDYLLQENIHYKRVHKTLNTQLQFIEKKVKDVRSEINTLQEQLQEQRTKEDFLKKVIKVLKDTYGSHNIQNAIEQVIEETTNESPKNFPCNEVAMKPQYEENFTNQAFQKKDFIQPESSGYYQGGEQLFAAESYAAPEVNRCQNTNVFANNEQNLDYSTSNSGSYLSWYVDFEKNIHNPDRFLDAAANRGAEIKSSFDNDIYAMPSSIF